MQSPVKVWRNQKKTAALLGLSGAIVAWTMIRVPQADFSDQAPYPVALVELENKKRMLLQLVDWDEKHLVVGQKVVTVVRRIADVRADGVIPYGIKVKPTEE